MLPARNLPGTPLTTAHRGAQQGTPAGFETAHTAPEAAIAIFRITAVDLGCLDYRQPVKRRSFRVSSGSC